MKVSAKTEYACLAMLELAAQPLLTAEFLAVDTERPLRARAAKDNVGSLRVLAKCGFEVTGGDIGFANARGQEIEEVVLRLS